MNVITTGMGFVLSFPNRKDLKDVANHLQGMLEWVEKENVDPPHLYAIFDDDIPLEKIDDLLDEIKGCG